MHIGLDQALSNGMTLTFQFTGTKGRVGLVGGANEGVGSRGPYFFSSPTPERWWLDQIMRLLKRKT